MSKSCASRRRTAAAKSRESRAATLDPADHAPAFEAGVLAQSQGDAPAALAHFQRAAQLRPRFFPALFSAGLLQFDSGNWDGAIESLQAALEAEPGHVDAMINLGLALCEQGDAAAGEQAIAQAVTNEPANPAARHALGWAMHRAGRPREALPHFEFAAQSRPDAIDWQLSLAKALGDLARHEEALQAYERALALDPDSANTLRLSGRHAVARGDFPRASALFARALRREPEDDTLWMYLAQVDLLQERWATGWAAYAHRDPRRHFERELAAAGRAYHLPPVAELAGRAVTLVAEQGLGDTLRFLRFAPILARAGARLRFAGDPRLHSLLARTGLFPSMTDAFARDDAGAPILVADLPFLLDEPWAPTLSIRPEAARVDHWRARLGSIGPRPWIGITWRAGTPPSKSIEALHKTIGVELLCGRVAPMPGTVFALQRDATPEELARATGALGRALHDLSAALLDLEDALALISLLDRHVAMSNTNLHLAALAGREADALVPFPPEWSWGLRETSPWFPQMRVHRQDRDGDWLAALRAIPG